MKKVLFAFAIVAFATACNSEGSSEAAKDSTAAKDSAAKVDTSNKMAQDTTKKADSTATKMAADTTKKK